MLNYIDTVISQYANSPTLMQLIENFNGYIDPRVNFQEFYDKVWNIDTAVGFGLDIWGRIVGVRRTMRVAHELDNFGYVEGEDYQPFDQAPFYDSSNLATVTLNDTDYRKLILLKAFANICIPTAQSLNKILRQLIGNDNCYVADAGEMTMVYVFNFPLTPTQYGIITQTGAMPKPAGVHIQISQILPEFVFGFAGTEFQPFGQGVFIP